MTLTETTFDAVGDDIWRYGLVFLRVSAFVVLTPIIGTFQLPSRVKLALAIALTLACGASAAIPNPVRFADLWLLILVEVSIGFAFGLSVRLFVMGLQTAGTIVGQSTSLSQVLGTPGVEPLPAVGQLFVVGGAAIGMALGLHVKIVEFLHLSYVLVPLGTPLDAGTFAVWTMERVSEIFVLAVTISAPFLGLALIYNLALGAINRAMPQLMVAFVGAPFITLLALVTLAIASPLLLEVWRAALFQFLENPTGPL